MTIAAVQQPEHLPWLGFFDKMQRCDIYAYLDNVQFKKRYFENRNRILNQHTWQWVTVPVMTRGRYKQLIRDVRIDQSRNWKQVYVQRMYHQYCRFPFFDEIFPQLKKIINSDHERLLDLNLELIDMFRHIIDIQTPVVSASDLGLDELYGSRLILEICSAINADQYISGPDGVNYLDLDTFRHRGIDVNYHTYEHPQYVQRNSGEFISHLSVLDALMNIGAEETRRLFYCATMSPAAETECNGRDLRSRRKDG